MAEIFTVLALSTGHLTEAAAGELSRALADGANRNGVIGCEDGYGWWLFVGRAVEPTNVAAATKACIDYARDRGVRYIRFDADVEPIPELPYYGRDAIKAA